MENVTRPEPHNLITVLVLKKSNSKREILIINYRGMFESEVSI